MKKIVLLSFVFLLFSTAVVVIFVCPVVAEETIHIRPDGTVEGTDKIQRDGNVYTFTDNINVSIVIERSNIIINGNGYTVEGRYVSESKGIFLKLTSNVTIKNVAVKKFYYGIRVIASSDNSIQGNTVTNNMYGIFLFAVFSDNRIQGNTITENTEAGIWLDASLNSRFQGNTITNNYYGIKMERSSNITITENNITSNEDGIRLLYSSNSSITNNAVANNENRGIELYYASNNSIHGNNITSNEVHNIRLRWSSDNAIYHNNFTGNTEQVQSENSTNTWDDGAGKGNYWSDYEERYPNATEIDGSGVWGTPYIIDENNQDNYPLVPEFPTLPAILLTLIVLAVAIAIYKYGLLKTPAQ